MLASPALGVVCLLLLLGVVLVARLQPFLSASGPTDVVLTWGRPAAWVGVSLALATLSNAEPFLVRLDPRTRFWGELGALLIAAAYLQLPIFAAALLAGAAPADLGRSLPAILSSDLQLASLAHLFLIPALSTAPRTCLFLAAVAIVPALLALDARLAPLAALLEADPMTRAPSTAAWSSTLAVGAALALAGYLLRTGPARAPAA